MYLFVLLLALTPVTWALEDIDNFREGPCSLNTAEKVVASRSFVDSLKYLSAGSKFHLYRPLTRFPNYTEISEGDFHYDSCPSHNITHTEPYAGIFAFGRLLSVSLVRTPPGMWIEGHPLGRVWDSVQHSVTLTDHKTFAFFTNCLPGAGQRTWNIVTLTPDVHRDPRIRKLIEDHAIAQGFNKEHFLFLRYDSCRNGLGNPLLEGQHHPSHHNLLNKYNFYT